MRARAALDRLQQRILPWMPTTAWTLDRNHRIRAAARTRPRDPGAPPPLSDLDPTDLRRGDVAVILGSGPSARRVEEPSIADDPTLDYFALNHAGALPVPARLYSIEEPVLKGRQGDMSREDAVDLLTWSLRRSRMSETGAPLVIRGDWHDDATRDLASRMAPLGGPVVVAPRFALPVRGRRGPERYARWVRDREPFGWPEGDAPVLSPRGGLGFLVSVCIALGYPTIVLAGVDMTSDEYFFDAWEGDEELARLRARLRPSTSSPHLTAVATRRRPAVGGLLVALDRGYLRPAGRKLLVGSESSLLHPDLRAFDWTEPAGV